jgi:DNA cross-link repair 1A protein
MSVGVKRKVVEVIDIDDDLDDFQPLKKPKAEPKNQFKAEKIEPKEPKIEAQQNITRAVNIESAQSTQSQLISICLVCDRPLYHLSVQEREQHVIACLDQSGVWDDELTNESEATLHSADQSENNTNVTLATAPSTPVTARVTPRAVSSAPRPQLSKSVSQPLSLVRAMQSKITSWFKTDSAPNSPTHALTRANSAVQPLTRSDTGVSAAKNSPPVAKETSPKPARQICPFYKRVPHTPIIVDGFACQYAEPANPIFFLSHFHADHYKGLGPNFNRGPIYCTQITANLLLTRLRVKALYIHVLPMRVETAVPNLPNVTVQFFDANHCPGAVLMLFKLADGTHHLHSGDFRYDSELEDHRTLRQFKIHNLYLDTTYCNPKYAFPPQSTVISHVIDVFSRAVQDAQTLVLIGTYTIGKEKFFLSLASIFECKIFVNKSKMQILKCLDLEARLLKLFTCNEDEANVHIVPLWSLNVQKLEALLQQHRRYRRIVAFRPTGWSYKGGETMTAAPVPSQNKSRSVAVYGVPYSEHSSFTELRACVREWNAQWIVPTVNNYKREQVDEMVRLLRE